MTFRILVRSGISATVWLFLCHVFRMNPLHPLAQTIIRGTKPQVLQVYIFLFFYMLLFNAYPLHASWHIGPYGPFQPLPVGFMFYLADARKLHPNFWRKKAIAYLQVCYGGIHARQAIMLESIHYVQRNCSGLHAL